MRRLIFILLTCALVGCDQKAPDIGSGLPSNYAEGERVFDARVKERFPAGSEESELVAELKRQGFSIVPTREGDFATFSNGAFPVETVWHIGWKANDGQVNEIWGVYGGRGP